MINNPKYGWCNFNLGDFHGTPSYLTNVPVDLLKGFIRYFKKGVTAIWFDEEGKEFTLVINPYSMFIISEHSEKPELIDISEMHIKNMAMELINDIKKDFQGWTQFVVCEEDFEKQSQLISELLIELNGYIN